LLEIRGTYVEKIDVIYTDEKGRERKFVKDKYYDENGKEIDKDLEDLNKVENRVIIRNLDKLVDEKLILELISFNLDGNFDAVMSMAACVIALEESHNKYVKVQQTIDDNKEFSFLTHNKSLFKNPHKQTNFIL
jgi:hypothetical protein